MAGKEMHQELHRHDFYYVLALENGTGSHQIDFITYIISDYTIFFMHPGQVHQLAVNTGAAGYLMQFRDEFYFPKDKSSNQLLRKASQVNYYQLNAQDFKKPHTILTYIFQEDAEKKRYMRMLLKQIWGFSSLNLVGSIPIGTLPIMPVFIGRNASKSF